ncbi:hypothetical protein [Cyclobacterium xiamenense]|uniref:hypothetical protein n=1 Tax=Cyclobacterium xiamenense TaxID=1297121 RepID=UPI0035D02ABD
MKKALLFMGAILTMLAANCGAPKQVVVPLNDSIHLDDHACTLMWNGISKAYRSENDAWKRVEPYDYRFNVVRKRYEGLWKSVRTRYRIHPEYDDKAGDRNQTMNVEIMYGEPVDGKVHARINSSLGSGSGTPDPTFRNAVPSLPVPNPKKGILYTKLKIPQQNKYEAGLLTETVELIHEKNGREIPFMTNEESAYIFSKSKLDQAPIIVNH